jgi:hypothetical protein
MINFENNGEGKWFQVEPGTDECGSFKFRTVSVEEYEKIEKITVRTKKKVKRGIAYDDVTIDERLAAKMRWDYIIMDWKNVLIEGKVAKCDAANKALIVKYDNFIKFALVCIEELNDENKAIEEAKLKNSEKSSDLVE